MMLFTLLVSWRVLLFIVAFFTHHYYPFTPQFPYSDIYLIPSKLPSWVWSWANFDGVHYLTIAKSGYAAQFTQVFFPLYPILIRLISKISFSGISDAGLIGMGLLISFVSFVVGTLLFRKLLRFDYEPARVKKILSFLLLFPTSFYFAALYTESVFFLLVIAAFWFSRKKQWWWCGLCGALASATRITGIFLWLALLWEFYESNKNFNGYKKLANLIFSPVFYLPPLGLIGYMGYLYFTFGDALYFWHAQSVFGAERTGSTLVFPLQVVFRYFKILTTVSLTRYGFWVAVWELSAFIGGMLLLIYGHLKKVRLSYLLFGWLVLIIPTLTGTFSSLPRYLLLAFPVFIAASLLKSKIVSYFLWTISGILLIIFSSLFLRGLWVA